LRSFGDKRPRLIGAKKLSPVERHKLHPAHRGCRSAVNAMVARDSTARSRGARTPRRCDARRSLGALHGLPLGVKDLIDAKGLPTTYGSPVFKARSPRRTRARLLRCRSAVR